MGTWLLFPPRLNIKEVLFEIQYDLDFFSSEIHLLCIHHAFPPNIEKGVTIPPNIEKGVTNTSYQFDSNIACVVLLYIYFSFIIFNYRNF